MNNNENKREIIIKHIDKLIRDNIFEKKKLKKLLKTDIFKRITDKDNIDHDLLLEFFIKGLGQNFYLFFNELNDWKKYSKNSKIKEIKEWIKLVK